MDAALVIYTLNSSTIFGVNFDSIFFSSPSFSLLLFNQSSRATSPQTKKPKDNNNNNNNDVDNNSNNNIGNKLNLAIINCL